MVYLGAYGEIQIEGFDWKELAANVVDFDSIYLDTLHLEQSASMKEIKSAYRKEAKRWHPDLCVEGTTQECEAGYVHESLETVATLLYTRIYLYRVCFVFIISGSLKFKKHMITW